MKNIWRKIKSKIRGFHITDGAGKPKISQNRDTAASESHEINNIGQSRLAEHCPYCSFKDFVKRGTRRKKLETVQLYICRNPECGRTFTAQFVKGKQYPLNIVIEGLNYYNLGFGLEETCRLLKKKFGAGPEAATLSEWIKEYSELCRYARLRPFAVKLYKPKDTVEVVTMAHRQLYRFRYHHSKIRLILSEYPNSRFQPLKEYLDGIASETPHQYFQEGLRISEVRTKFDKAQMIVRGKRNYANRLADFVLQAVKDNARRHEELQRFFIANDSVTVASEVPVYIRREDIEHMENVLKFNILNDGVIEVRQHGKGLSAPKGRGNFGTGTPIGKLNELLLTGHIDILQVRNGQVHILDYKPNAAKEKPIEQLTWYALALSRLTGLRLYEFKCAWFDEKDYFEFYPLHVVHKLSERKRRKRVVLKGGTMVKVHNKNVLQVV